MIKLFLKTVNKMSKYISNLACDLSLLKTLIYITDPCAVKVKLTDRVKNADFIKMRRT